MKIITDTNIWYNISEGKYSYERVKGLNLCLTAVNVMELLISPRNNTPDGKKSVKKACGTIKKMTPNYIEYLPLEYIATKVIGKKIKKGMVKFNIIDRIIKDDFSEDDRKVFSDGYKQIKFEYKSTVDIQTKENLNNDELRERMKNINEATIAAIRDTISELKKNFGISIPDGNTHLISSILQKLNFYYRGRAANYQEMILKGHQTAKNDQMDLYNMAYVGADDMYWTDDKKWLRKVHFQGIEKYLFTLCKIY